MLLHVCLASLNCTQRTYHLEWYCKTYDQVLFGFRSKTYEGSHSSIILVRELLKHAGDFMLPRFREVCGFVVQLYTQNSNALRESTIQLLPELAAYRPESFSRLYVKHSIDFLLTCAKSPELLPHTLVSIGKLCRALGTYLSDHADRVDQLLGECGYASFRHILTAAHNNRFTVH